MVTEAKENSSAPLSRVPLAKGGGAGPSSCGAAGPSSTLARFPTIPSAAGESYSILGYQEWKREVKQLRCFV